MKQLPEDVPALLRLVEQIRRKDPKLLPVALWLIFFSEPSASALEKIQPRGKDFMDLIEQADSESLQTALWLLLRFELHSGQGLLERHQPNAEQLTALLELAPDTGQKLLAANSRAQAIVETAYTTVEARNDLDRIVKEPWDMRRIVAECPNIEMLLVACEKSRKNARGIKRSRLAALRKTLKKTLEIDVRAARRRAVQAAGERIPRFTDA
ncbi:MAG: hypothetical protein GY856_44450 [bacterium]|nr:hypothetical protein [bacterium]